jgi:hypothetical protein
MLKAVRIYSIISSNGVYRFFNKKQRKTMLENTNMNGQIDYAPTAIEFGKYKGGSPDKDEIKQQTNLQNIATDAAWRLWEAQAKWTTDYNTPENQVSRLKAAGLNPALMYGNSSGVSSSAIGTGGSAGAITSQRATNKMANTQMMGMALQLAKAKAEIKVLDTTSQKQAAEAKNINEQTQTTIESREALTNELKQRGMGQWLDNIAKMYGHGTDGTQTYHNDFYGTRTIEESGLFNKERTTAILESMSRMNLNESEEEKTIRETALTDEKIKGYIQELANDTMRARAAEKQGNAAEAQAIYGRMEAEAKKLDIEWKTGEKTNWKTWVDLGKDVADMAIDAAGTIGKIQIQNQQQRRKLP